jgi:1-acyl-sn-glycerol-3-phosphate acyltransferase
MFRPRCLPDGNKEKRGSKLTGLFRRVHSAVFWLLTVVYTAVIHAVSCALALFVKSEDEKNRVFQKGAKLWGSLLADASLVKVSLSGLENIPAGTNVIFAPNHQSFLDIFILLKYLPGTFRFVIMRKLFKVPVLGAHITRSGFLSLDRKDRKGSIKTIHKVIDLLGSGESFVIFPEGKLTADGSIDNFGRGTSLIIQRSRKAVVPIAIDGTFSVLPKGAWELRPGEVTVKIGRPVYFEKYYGEINKETSLEVGNELREMVLKLKDGDRTELCSEN